jgi:aspartyl aminopeptidase
MGGMTPQETAADLCQFIDRAPSPFHAVAECARRLEAAGFERLAEVDAWAAAGGRCFAVRGGSLVAWARARGLPPERGFRVVAAHTDSPNLRIKARPNCASAGWRQLAVEVYGGALLNSWLDRDLGLSGRVVVRAGKESAARLLSVDRPLLRLPQLAIHLDREVNEKGLVLDRQRHMVPVWALGDLEPDGLERFLARELAVAPRDVLAWDLMLHDVQGARILGREGELVSAPRLDNLCSCHAGLTAFLAACIGEPAHVPVLCLFDHEEVGSSSRSGALGPLLETLLERAVLCAGGGAEERHRALADSFCVSADMAHATHPNYPERHEPGHWIEPNRGPVIKINTNQRYATDAEGEALFQRCCEAAGVPVQKYFHRGNLACGTTVGPLTAARLGLAVVDVGLAQLAMHSARELCGSADPAMLVAALTAFYRG